jgi:hypothetical protein
MLYTDELCVNNPFLSPSTATFGRIAGVGGASGEGCAKTECGDAGTQEAPKMALIPTAQNPSECFACEVIDLSPS